MESIAFTGRGFNPKTGTLSLDGNRLRYVVDDRVLFDAPLAELRLTWPWYGFGCQFWAHTPSEKYFVSLMGTGNTSASWWAGVRRGREWKRAIDAAMRL